MKFPARLAVAAIAVAAFVAWSAVYYSKAQPTLSLPFATVTSVGASAVQILPANPTRRSITLSNPSASLIMYAARYNRRCRRGLECHYVRCRTN